MRHVLIPCLVLMLAACATLQSNVVTKLETPQGQLFCQIETVEGPTVVGIIDGAASAAIPPPGNLITVLATNATAAQVQADCAAAAAATGAKVGIPVSPPSTSVGNVAITQAFR